MLSLPPPADLERRCVALAMLDAILSPDWEYRYHSFNRRWSEAEGERMGSMRDGCGDDYFILFFGPGLAALKGFAHESTARSKDGRVPGVLDGIPAAFASFLNEPAFDTRSATFVLWFDGQWRQSAAVPAAVRALDGSGELLRLLCAGPEVYAEWASDYFESPVEADVVERFFQLEPLTLALVRGLHPGASWGDLADDLDEIGYPVMQDR